MAKDKLQQAQIQFYKTMTANKRGAGAYLRKNLLNTDEEGIYPAVDFVNKRFASNNSVDSGHLIINDYVFIEEGSVTKVYYNTGASDLVFKVNMPDPSDPVAVAETNEENKVLVLLDDGKLYSVQNTTVALIHDFGSGSGSAYMVYSGFFWYISISNVIYRLDPDFSAPTVVKYSTGQSQDEIVNMQLFDKYLIIVRSLGRFIQFDFWDTEEADADLYQKRVVEENCRHLAFGNVGGSLLFIKSIGNSSNAKEKSGNIVVTTFDGEKFVELNSIRAGDDMILSQGSQSQSVGNGVMILAISGNDEALTDSLFKNWVLKIKNDGSIETVFEPDDITDGLEVKAINIEYSSISMLFEKTDNESYFYQTKDASAVYSGYSNYSTSEYITNLLNNPKNVHKLVSFGIAYEKVFEKIPGGEALFIDYRASERDDWTLLHEVNSETIKDYTADEYNEDLRLTEYNDSSTGQTIQSYETKKMPDGESELPRFNEIQFRFRTTKGFSIIQAWYNYSYIKRNTI